MNTLTVKMKLFIGFGTLLVVLVLSALVGFLAVVQLDGAADEVASMVTEKELSMLLMESVFKESSGTRGFLVSGQEKVLERDKDGQREFRETASKVVPLVHTEQGKVLYAEIQHAQDGLRAVLDEEIRLRRAGKVKEAESLSLTQEEDCLNAVDAATDAFVAHLTEGEMKVNEEQDTTVARSKVTVVSLGVAGIALGLILSAFIARSIIVATRQMRDFIQEIAGNNLAVADVEIRSRDEIGEACSALNAMKTTFPRRCGPSFPTRSSWQTRARNCRPPASTLLPVQRKPRARRPWCLPPGNRSPPIWGSCPRVRRRCCRPSGKSRGARPKPRASPRTPWEWRKTPTEPSPSWASPVSKSAR